MSEPPPDESWKESAAKRRERIARLAKEMPPPTLEELQTKLADARQEVRNLTVMQMLPGLSPNKKEIMRQLERSARAEVKLRVMALEHYLSQQKK
jgi:hypothetical protein